MEWLNTNSPEEVVLSVIPRFRKRLPPFDKRINVEDWVPQSLPDREKAMFIFLTTSVDYGMKSPVLYKGMLELIKEYPWFLDPQRLSHVSNQEIIYLVRKFLHLRWPQNATRYYKENAKKLVLKYQGNPINIFKKIYAKRVVEELKTFLGFGSKTTYLAFRATVNIFKLTYKDIDDVGMPIDRHKLRATYYWGFITEEDFAKRNIHKVANIWITACKNTQISWLEFDRAFWILTRNIRLVY